MPKPKSIDEAIKTLKRLDETHKTVLFLHHQKLWSDSVEDAFQYLLESCEKFILKAFKANLKSPNSFSVSINFLKYLEFNIDAPGGTKLYVCFQEEWKQISIEKAHYQQDGRFYFYTCPLLIESYEVLQEFNRELDKHSKLK